MPIASLKPLQPQTIGGTEALVEMREIQRQRRASKIRFAFPKLD